MVSSAAVSAYGFGKRRTANRYHAGKHFGHLLSLLVKVLHFSMFIIRSTQLLILATGLALLLAGCAIHPDPRYRSGSDRSTSQTTDSKKSSQQSTAQSQTYSTDNLDGTIESWWGTPYRNGGSKKRVGVDCSAYVQAVYKTVWNKTLPRNSTQQYRVGTPVQRDQLKRGDLVFFNTSGRGVSHVGIYLGGGLFTHASNSDGVTISKLSSSYYSKRYVGAKRIL